MAHSTLHGYRINLLFSCFVLVTIPALEASLQGNIALAVTLLSIREALYPTPVAVEVFNVSPIEDEEWQNYTILEVPAKESFPYPK